MSDPKKRDRNAEVGDIIHHVLNVGPRRGECRPGIVVRVLDTDNGIVRAFLVLDGAADETPYACCERLVGIRHNRWGAPGTWHRRDKCPEIYKGEDQK